MYKSYSYIFDKDLMFDPIYTENNTDACLGAKCDFLFNRIVDITFEKLSILLKKNDNLLHLGCRNSKLADLLQQGNFLSREKLFCCDTSYDRISKIEHGRKVVLDEEFLPFAEQTFDIIVSTMSLHYVSNLPSIFLRINNILKKDGVFIGTLFGLRTLNELQHSMLKAELKFGVVRSRTIPFTSAEYAASLLKGNKFINSVLDVYTVVVKYRSIFDLFHDLRDMAEANMLYIRNEDFLSKSLVTDVEKFYVSNFAQDDSYIPATFEVIIMQATKSK